MVDFGTKLRQLRKDKNLTQEELAEALFVSRAAISKWESGRGYPGIDSLRLIAENFSVTIDELLSGDQIVSIAKRENEQKQKSLRNRVFGLLDCGVWMLWILPFFAQRNGGTPIAVSLAALGDTAAYLTVAFWCLALVIPLFGILTLVLQNSTNRFWLRWCNVLSLGLSALGAMIFIVSLQPYAAAFVFLLLIIKGLMLIKTQ